LPNDGNVFWSTSASASARPACGTRPNHAYLATTSSARVRLHAMRAPMKNVLDP
jgi:hypothetical protein